MHHKRHPGQFETGFIGPIGRIFRKISSSANEKNVDDITENCDFGIDEYYNEENNNEELQFVEGDDMEQKINYEDDVGIPQAMNERNGGINICAVLKLPEYMTGFSI